MALLTAMSLIVWIIEAQIPPPVPVPGIKLGLASIFTLTAMVTLSRRDALAVMVMRVILSSVFSGSVSVILFSLTGGLLSWAVMALLLGVFADNRLWVVSVFGAVAHNFGQLAAAAAVTGTLGIFAYFPALLCAGILTGAFTGVIAMYVRKALHGRL